MYTLLINSSGGGIAGTLDANYFKGQGERQGTEREFVVMVEGCNWDGGQVSPTLTAQNAGGGVSGCRTKRTLTQL